MVLAQPTGAGAEHGEAPAVASPSPAKATQLDIWEVVVDGNTVLDDESIEKAMAPFMGPNRSSDDVDKARARLEDTYRERGFRTVSVSIPRQTVRDGVVLLQVTEGKVGHLNVIGSKYHSIDRIKEQAPALAEGKVPDFNQVQQDIVALNQQQDRQVTPSLKAGARPGTVDVDLTVEDELPLHGSFELNNRRSQDTSDLRASASLSYDNLWQRGHSLSLSFLTAPEHPDDAKVFFGAYLARFDTSPWSILFNALNSDSNVSTVGGINVLGNGSSASIAGIRQLASGDGFYPSLSLGVAYKDFATSTLLGTASFETPVTYYPITIGYSAVLRGAHDLAQADVSMNFASPQLGSDTETIELNRFQARGQMFWLRASLSDLHEFANGMQAFGRIAGQLTDQPLISNEQISAGGMDTARGYLEAEALGDYGYNGSLELRAPSIGESWSFAGSLQPIQEFRPFVFVDAADLRLQGPLPDDSTPDRTELLSVGVGLNLTLYSSLNGVLDWAYPLKDGPATDEGDERVLFRVWTSF